MTTDTTYIANRFRIQIPTLLAFSLQDTIKGNIIASHSNDVHTRISSDKHVSNLSNINSMTNSVLNQIVRLKPRTYS